jgi:hypothetical protein
VAQDVSGRALQVSREMTSGANELALADIRARYPKRLRT